VDDPLREKKGSPSKDSVLVVELRVFAVRDEELRAIGVWSSVCHGYYASSIVLEHW
jgi:hypothetical protein